MAEHAVVTEPMPKLKMVHGSEGRQDYVVIARNGNFLLAIKLNVIANGEVFGVPNTIYVGAKLRSAPILKYFDEEDKEAGAVVVQFQPNMTPASAWPLITFEKVAPERASSQIGNYIPGNLLENNDMLLEQLIDKKFAKQFAEYLISQAGDDNMYMSKEDLIQWLHAHYSAIFIDVTNKLKDSAAIKEAMSAQVGVFGNHAAALKKMQAANHEVKKAIKTGGKGGSSLHQDQSEDTGDIEDDDDDFENEDDENEEE